MMIATVDKFAMMAWRGQVRTLFGQVEKECERHGLLWPGANCTGNHLRTLNCRVQLLSISTRVAASWNGASQRQRMHLEGGEGFDVMLPFSLNVEQKFPVGLWPS